MELIRLNSPEVEHEESLNMRAKSPRGKLKKTNISLTKKKVRYPAAHISSESLKNSHLRPEKIVSVFATLGKISGVLRRTRAIVKYKDINNLTARQLNIIQDVSSDRTAELELQKRMKNVEQFI